MDSINSNRLDTNQLSRKTSLALQTQILRKFFNFISIIFVARYMGVEVLGIIGFALAYVASFNIFSDLGTGIAHRKMLAEGLDIDICNGTLITIKSFLNILMVLTLVSWLYIYRNILGGNFETNELEVVIYIFIISQFFENFVNLNKNLWGARLKIGIMAFFRVFGRFSAMILTIFVCVEGFSVVHLASVSILAAFVIFIPSFLLFVKNNSIRKPDLQIIKSYLSFGIPISILGMITLLTLVMDKLMLGFFNGVLEVGQYTAAQRIADIMIILTTSLSGILFTVFSDYHSNQEYDKAQQLSMSSEKYISLTLLPFVIFIFLFSEEIMTLLFGKEFSSSGNILSYLCVAVYFNLLRMPFTTQILSSGNLKLAFGISFFVLILNIILNMLLIPESIGPFNTFGYSGDGAAIATLITFFVGGVLVRFWVYRINGVVPYAGLLSHYLAAIASTISVFLFSTLFPFTIWFIIPYSLMSTLIFLLILVPLNEFGFKEIMFYYNALNPSKMKKLIVSEFSNKKI